MTGTISPPKKVAGVATLPAADIIAGNSRTSNIQPVQPFPARARYARNPESPKLAICKAHRPSGKTFRPCAV